MNAFRIEIARAFSSRGFPAGTAGFVLCALFGAWRPILSALTEKALQESGFALRCIESALESRWLILALPIFAAMPYSASFVEDHKSRFLRSYLPRTGRRDFLAARAGATAVSGAAVMAAGSIITCLVVMLVLLPKEMRPDPLQRQDIEAMQIALVSRIAEQILLLCLSGSLWALVGAAAAAVSMNHHLALAAPFIFFYILVILSTRYFPDIETLNPELWVRGTGIWQDVPYAAGLLDLELSLAAGIILVMVMERRLRDV